MLLMRNLMLAGLVQCVSARDEAGQTALHKAAMNGQLECIHLLLDNGADVNAIDHAGDDVTEFYYQCT